MQALAKPPPLPPLLARRQRAEELSDRNPAELGNVAVVRPPPSPLPVFRGPGPAPIPAAERALPRAPAALSGCSRPALKMARVGGR